MNAFYSLLSAPLSFTLHIPSCIPQASSAKYGEALKNCVLYLGKEVIDPLEEFEFGMKFSKDSLQEMYRNQYMVLHGATPDHTEVEANPSSALSASSASLTASISGKDREEGLLQQYETAKRRHVTLKKQLDALGEKLSLQKEVAASSLHFSQRQRVSLTRAEELYSLQVQRWGTMCQRLDVSLDRVKEQVEDIRTGGVDTCPSPSRGSSNSSNNNSSNSNKASSTRKAKSFMTPTKPRPTASSLSSVHISSPHRISYRNSPATGNPCRVLSSTGSGNGIISVTNASEKRKKSNILLHNDEKNSCAQLQQETGNLHDALLLKIKNVEERMSKLSTTI